MSAKIKFEQEYLLKTSAKVLENMLFTPSGLSEWFADDVNIKEDIYTFFWDGDEEDCRLITKKMGEKIRWQKIEDEEEGLDTYFEMEYHVDPMTKVVILNVTDFEYEEDLEETKQLWDHLIGELKRILGA